ncbi:MAG: AI-2E family transporter [Desulfobacterales bacterium]|nr:AI-2E family transporter [Desulfobacterales bacterium]
MTEPKTRIEQVMVLVIIALLIVGSIVIIFPFLRAMLWAMVFSVTVWPFFLKVERLFGGRSGLAAVVPTLLITLVFFLPLIYAGSQLVTQVPVALDYTQALMEKGMGDAPLWLQKIPWVGERLVTVWQDIGTYTPKLIAVAKPYIKTLIGSLVSAGAGMAKVVLTAVLSLLLLFFLLKEGHAVRASLEKMACKLSGEKGRQLLLVAGATMRSVVNGILITALVQGVLAFLGLWIAGVPNPLFLATAAGLFALIPVGLIQAILLPAAGWLLYNDQTGWGIFLFIWSFFVVGNIDQFLRPMLISRGAKVPFLVILLGVLGGLATGGFIGLFVGATVLAVFFTMLREWAAEPAGENTNAGDSETGRDEHEE